MIPSIAFPASYDTDTTLYNVKDSAYLVLAKDYNPNDTTITVEFDNQKTLLFPASGIITLTEQCSDVKYRGLSFYYTTRTNTVFSGLTILNPELDHYKPSRVTTVVMNVVAEHHNNIKDAVINIENYVGKKDIVGNYLSVNTGKLEERTNFLISRAFEPKAWFSVDKRIGLAPFTVNFKNQSVRLGENIPNNSVQYYWDFGDSTSSSATGDIAKTYTQPGTFDVSLTVTNNYGTDTIEFVELINTKYNAPDNAVFEFSPIEIQQVVNGVFKSPTNLLIALNIPSGINISTGKTYSGEEVDGLGDPIDPVIKWTWLLSDDTNHGNDQNTTAFYSIGGLYDIVIKVDTASQAFRITSFNSYVNVIERQNIWMSTFFGSSTTDIQTSEYGLISETFKTKQSSTFTLTIDADFLDTDQLKKEFKKNTAFTSRANVASGLSGTTIMHYATGRNTGTISDEKINSIEYNGYLETYSSYRIITRPWNWVGLSFLNKVYFIFGNLTTGQNANTSRTNLTMQTHNLIADTLTESTLSAGDFVGGATALLNNASQFDIDGNTVYGNFSAYRYAWRNRKGYIVKNNGVGSFFQIKSFFSSYETAETEVAGFTRLPDILGTTKYEGQLVNLSSGLFLFNNTGSISSFDTTTNVWKTGGPGLNAASFTALQDKTASGYDKDTNTLLATTDLDRRAYLSFDYSSDAYIKFNDLDLTFTKLSARPSGTQWNFGTF